MCTSLKSLIVIILLLLIDSEIPNLLSLFPITTSLSVFEVSFTKAFNNVDLPVPVVPTNAIDT